MTSVFADARNDVYQYRYAAELLVGELHGGIPSDPKVAEGWIRTKLQPADDILRELVVSTMADRGVTAEEALEQVDALKHLNGFKRTGAGELYIEGRQVKAMIKEAANIRWAKERWGVTRKGTRSFFAEHVFVPETVIGLGVSEPSGVSQRFVHTWRGSGIQYEEYVADAKVAFTVVTDHEFTDKQWAELWVTAEQNGLGATRSQSYGVFDVTRWERLM